MRNKLFYVLLEIADEFFYRQLNRQLMNKGCSLYYFTFTALLFIAAGERTIAP